MNWNLFGLNPTFREFLEEHPDKTMIGLAWSLQWRLMVLILLCELLIMIVFGLFGFLTAIF